MIVILLIKLVILILILRLCIKCSSKSENLSLTASTQLYYPQQIIIIRHGEKPPTGNNLIPQGYTRSYCLVDYFQNSLDTSLYNTPDVIYAQKCSGWDGQNTSSCTDSARPIETVLPFSNSQGIVMNINYKETDYVNLAQNIFTTPTNEGKTVLICWEHDHIVDVANSIFSGFTDGIHTQPAIVGWNYNPFDSDDSSIFDMAWIFTYNNNGQSYSFNVIPEFEVNSSPPYICTPFNNQPFNQIQIPPTGGWSGTLQTNF